jgi:hypothetical protein
LCVRPPRASAWAHPSVMPAPSAPVVPSRRLCAAVALLLAAMAGQASAAKNILFLMCDSMDGRVLDPTSPVSSRLQMPNLRRLAAEGTNFVRTYAASPQVGCTALFYSSMHSRRAFEPCCRVHAAASSRARLLAHQRTPHAAAADTLAPVHLAVVRALADDFLYGKAHAPDSGVGERAGARCDSYQSLRAGSELRGFLRRTHV